MFPYKPSISGYPHLWKPPIWNVSAWIWCRSNSDATRKMKSRSRWKKADTIPGWIHANPRSLCKMPGQPLCKGLEQERWSGPDMFWISLNVPTGQLLDAACPSSLCSSWFTVAVIEPQCQVPDIHPWRWSPTGELSTTLTGKACF